MNQTLSSKQRIDVLIEKLESNDVAFKTQFAQDAIRFQEQQIRQLKEEKGVLNHD